LAGRVNATKYLSVAVPIGPATATRRDSGLLEPSDEPKRKRRLGSGLMETFPAPFPLGYR
jgi:hypothetical protein